MFEQLKGRPPARTMEPLPGWFERRRRNLPPARGRAGAAAAWRGGEAGRGACGRGDGVVIRIHQVLATLGYGDAIGHEVLGIQRVLRAAGYESEIFVEAADHRLEAMTRDYRELIDFSHPDNLLLHHFSLASKASRTAFALPDRMALIYHNITPPEFFVGLHRSLSSECFRGRRELARLRRSVRSRARRFRVQPPGSRGARVQEDRRPAGRAGFLASRRGRRSHGRRSVRRHLDQRPVRRPDGAEQEDRRRDPLLSRVSHVLQPAVAAAPGRRPGRVRALHGGAPPVDGDAGQPAMSISSGRSRTRSWWRSTRSPISSCAPASTRASACRSSRRSTSRFRCWPTPPRPCRRRWTAPASCTTTRIRRTSRR